MDSKEDSIVISGIAGRYPECDNFNEFKEALLNGLDMVTEDSRRWKPGTYNNPGRAGKINDVEHFDAEYFNIPPRLAQIMDPRHRVIYETVFEAIVDSGYNPKELRGSNTGVYIGISNTENDEIFEEVDNSQGYCLLGISLGQVANRTSYCFDFKGPSFILDTACSSGFYALTNASKAIERGEIDSAIVGAVSINLHPRETRDFNALNMLSPDGKCKVFSTNRDGYVRSEAVVCVLLQKKSKCRRLYSTILGAEMNCNGFKAEGILYPSLEAQLRLMHTLYEGNKINYGDVKYVEMHGTGTPAGDKTECESISTFFSKNRQEPLLVGSVKSNMGHSEVAAGLCSISKVLVAMETGFIPANLHCENVDYSLPGISEGKLKVVTKNKSWNGGLTSLNCFGFGGTNAHLALKSNNKEKLRPNRMSYRLINVSGRTEESVTYYLEEVQKHQDDQEFLALIDEIHKMNVEGHPYRGYAVLGDNPISETMSVSKKNRPVWFIYSGIGSQWTGIGKDLMKLDIFKNTIKKCADVLKPYNLDLEHILTSDDPKIMENIVNCYAAITATEIALTDVLKAFGIEPDGFAGHSLGEVGCAYCNGDLTPEQAVLLGFARGYALKETKNPLGQMAAVGLSEADIKKYLPDDIFIACVNASNSVTITGLQAPVQSFVNSLAEKGIFAKLVESAGYALHSKYTENAAPFFLNMASKIISEPKPRSGNWISSSHAKNNWNSPIAQMNSAEYHYNNFRSPVLFEQVLKTIPKDSIVIEIAPHGLLYSILKREMGPEATCLSLCNRNSKDNVQFLLSNIGRLFLNGGQPNLRTFYNGVSFPVGRGTQNIGSLIKWDHSRKWFAPMFNPKKSFGKKVVLNTNMERYSYLKGHILDGRIIMPAAGYLDVMWQFVADINSVPKETLPIVLKSIQFLRITILPDNQDVVFYINIMRQSGYFEMFEGGSVVCSGFIEMPKQISQEFLNLDIPKVDFTEFNVLNKEEIYKWLYLKRYMITGSFQGLEKLHVSGTVGSIKWSGIFTSFFDSMFQIIAIIDTSRDLKLPSRILKLTLDPVKHLEEVLRCNNEIPLFYDTDMNVVRSGGVEFVKLEIVIAPLRQHVQSDPVMEQHVFIPYKNISKENTNIELSLKIALQIVAENTKLAKNICVHEIVAYKENSLISMIENIIKAEPLIGLSFVDVKSQNIDLVLCSDGYFNQNEIDILNNNGFLLYLGLYKDIANLDLPIVYQHSSNGQGVYLMRKITSEQKYSVIEVNNSDFTWLDELKIAIKEQNTVYVSNKNDDCSGILGLVKCLSAEPLENANIKCIFNKDLVEIEKVDSYQTQLFNQLAVNVYKGGVWGSYRHIPIKPIQEKEVFNAVNYIQTIGDLSTIKWVEKPVKPRNDEEQIFVYYSALNFRDIMEATGKVQIPTGNKPGLVVNAGMEYSGITESGKRIMGAHDGCVSLQIPSHRGVWWEVPDSWSLEEAVTIPTVYITCYYGMILRAQLKNKDTILIHAGAGGIGIAAITLALSRNCEVFTTVSSTKKRDFLLERFPQLKSENIGNSRNASFEKMIMKNTHGSGVNIIVNSLSSDLFQTSIRCLAQGGQFIEIGKVDLAAGTPISANLFSKNTGFHGVDINKATVKELTEIHRLINIDIKKRVVQPLPTIVFNEDQVEDAYRFFASSKHIGKVVIKIRDEHLNLPPQRSIKAMPRVYFDPEKTIVLIGGLGGIGLEVTDFLIKRNATKIILNSRKGISNSLQSLYLRKWSNMPGIDVKINTDDTTTVEGAERLISFAEQFGPVGGIFNMALVLHDALLINQTHETFEQVFKSKIISGIHMDQITRSRCLQLEHFVVFSSITSGRGNPGQSNYGMANSALERLCEKRRQDGLPGLAIQFGPVGDVGVLSDQSKYGKVVNVLGLTPQTIDSCINALETFMLNSFTVGSTFVLEEKNVMPSAYSSKTPIETVARVIGVRDIDLLDKNQTLGDLGLDSIMGAEIRQTLYSQFNMEIAAEEVRDLTIGRIMGMVEDSNSKSDNGNIKN